VVSVNSVNKLIFDISAYRMDFDDRLGQIVACSIWIIWRLHWRYVIENVPFITSTVTALFAKTFSPLEGSNVPDI
jgi:hypothetical protein